MNNRQIYFLQNMKKIQAFSNCLDNPYNQIRDLRFKNHNLHLTNNEKLECYNSFNDWAKRLFITIDSRVYL